MSKTNKPLKENVIKSEQIWDCAASKCSDIWNMCSVHHGLITYPTLALRSNLIVSVKNGLKKIYNVRYVKSIT